MSNGVQGNYVSNAAMLAWVSDLQDVQYGQLNGAMDFETQRGEMLQAVARLKKELNDASQSTDGMVQLNDDVGAFVTKYDGIPEFQDVVDTVKDFQDDTQSKADQVNDAGADKDKLPELFDKDGLEPWTTALSNAADAANHNEQLAMIRINEIKSTIDHSAEVASQLIKSSNDTSAFAINNIA